MRAASSNRHCKEHIGELRDDIYRDAKRYAACPFNLEKLRYENCWWLFSTRIPLLVIRNGACRGIKPQPRLKMIYVGKEDDNLSQEPGKLYTHTPLACFFGMKKESSNRSLSPSLIGGEFLAKKCE